MLTKADDYPVHQTPEPIAYAGTDRNFYDRYFFNGYDADGELFFAVALGVYPHLNIMDAAFCVVHDGVQHNLRASRLLGMERLDTIVGPIRVDVLEPLQRLRVVVAPNEHGITADLTFEARARPVEEPRFIRRQGPRTVMDYTRLTQNGSWSGWIDIMGQRFTLEPARFLGTRDRSWGIRPVGAPDSQPVTPAEPPQFFWLWAPLNFADGFSLYHLNADDQGRPWNTHGLFGALGDAEPRSMATATADIEYKPGTRHARSACLTFVDPAGGETRITLAPRWNFYMSGLGYLHPEWGHGLNKGDLAVGYDRIEIATADETLPPHWHVQAFVRAEMTGTLGRRTGFGVLEQLSIGAHAPSGFTGLMDMAK